MCSSQRTSPDYKSGCHHVLKSYFTVKKVAQCCFMTLKIIKTILNQMINALSPCLCSHDPLSKKLLNFKTAPLCESPPILFILTHLSFQSQTLLRGGNGFKWGLCGLETLSMNVILSFQKLWTTFFWIDSDCWRLTSAEPTAGLPVRVVLCSLSTPHQSDFTHFATARTGMCCDYHIVNTMWEHCMFKIWNKVKMHSG